MTDTRHIFTPYRSTRSDTRLHLHVSREDIAKIGRGHWGPVEVTDLDSGARLRVRSAPCGGGCHCAAVVMRTVEPGHKPMNVLVEERA